MISGLSHGFSSGTPLTLDQGGVHLWHSFPGEVVDELLISRYIEILSKNERLRYSRFITSEFAIQYLLTRVLIRTVLSQYLDTAPTDWIFRCNAHGKPVIDDSIPLGSDISFNISHTFGLVVVAVGRSMCIGIDAEPVDRLTTPEIADRVLTEGEVAAIRKLPLAEQKRRFIELWTLKES
ncbi:4'-phosphopantetheinyl transferase family protein [Verminephrobacter eiseniae]|uniref:4'-phosphopantetheinyl transferase family protein n=1 Tax=Verminephrobacter eiseniae TaxID=364317 RepID=UPI00223795C8|nr:4'-phosphopantetheinyl transferase superfamily protein [Verminephrobacter eiseniae]MCW5231605.1 4'-phosphopantetheinyl transferase superfamily protein [Verminephrobacter eiseniae]MCW5293335.1 4'-phosphopantetheinyl transferase superfamily protein [Verminephrobacter eiseniae]MCW8186792.1 4'-phosphopantetheinyl transferase superfamily protein [Verminephrobacter eiseniae]MCW8225154.1 4'-phosphopantetheinyl transferase superfamily protein [Verminephrobacter eiseniae]MCW8236102.1 4'-phosphopante